MSKLPPVPELAPGRYRHYKGNDYEVVAVARHSETLEPVVVYRALYGEGGLWIRPYAMFCESVVVDVHRVPRFAPVMAEHPIATWHRLVRTRDASGLHALLAEDAVFHSPVVHTPQRGRKLAFGYLSAAFQVFFNPTFRYIREVVGPSDAMLEFETELDGVVVNGVDIIKWNEAG